MINNKAARTTATILISLFLLYAAFSLWARPVPDHPFFEADKPLVIAHQGGDGLWPSNTMFAFRNAVNLGVDVLEMDVHSTSDGVIVVIHDATVDRTTNGSGRVQEFTFAELQTLDAGYRWPTLAEESHRTDRPFRGRGITIPALEEVLQSFPEMRFNIEIKQQEPSIARPLCQMLREYNLTEQALIASFHPQSIAEFRAACPEIPTAAVEPEIRTFFVLNSLYIGHVYPSTAFAFQVPEYSGGQLVLSDRFVRSAQRLNLDVHPWTINDPQQMARLLDLGVNGIITDYPDRMLALLEEGG